MNVRSAAARHSARLSARTDPAERPVVDLVAKRKREARFRQLYVAGLRLLVAVVFLGTWELTTRLGLIDVFFLSQPAAVAANTWYWSTQRTDLGLLRGQVLTTMEETVGGFVVGSLLGVVFGVALGRSRLLSDVLGPYIKAANAIPRVVVGALFAISLGLDIKSKIATAAVLVFFVVFFNAFQGVREVDRNLVANARILGASRWRVFTDVIMPSAMTWIIASLHISFGFALVGAIVGEYLGALNGIGLMIATAQGTFNPNGVYSAMLILAVVALTAESIV